MVWPSQHHVGKAPIGFELTVLCPIAATKLYQLLRSHSSCTVLLNIFCSFQYDLYKTTLWWIDHHASDLPSALNDTPKPLNKSDHLTLDHERAACVWKGCLELSEFYFRHLTFFLWIQSISSCVSLNGMWNTFKMAHSVVQYIHFKESRNFNKNENRDYSGALYLMENQKRTDVILNLFFLMMSTDVISGC